MTVGENSFTYTDKSSGERKVRITHEWVERSASKPPEAPEAVYPPDGGQAESTDFAFRWSAPKDPDGNQIADYRFMLASRQDMRWPLLTNFDKLISRSRGKAAAQPAASAQSLNPPPHVVKTVEWGIFDGSGRRRRTLSIVNR